METAIFDPKFLGCRSTVRDVIPRRRFCIVLIHSYSDDCFIRDVCGLLSGPLSELRKWWSVVYCTNLNTNLEGIYIEI